LRREEHMPLCAAASCCRLLPDDSSCSSMCSASQCLVCMHGHLRPHLLCMHGQLRSDLLCMHGQLRSHLHRSQPAPTRRSRRQHAQSKLSTQHRIRHSKGKRALLHTMTMQAAIQHASASRPPAGGALGRKRAQAAGHVLVALGDQRPHDAREHRRQLLHDLGQRLRAALRSAHSPSLPAPRAP